MLTSLGSISIEEFLAEYWQKKPLLIKNLFPEFECPLDHNDLAGLSLEDEVESRIVFENLDGKPWQLMHGPFEADFLETLPEENWTLLVQGLDHWIPEIADLLDRFRFLPNWRVDDIMASFAPVGGSVGPHYDQYDVFLIQAEGRRKWQIGPVCTAQTERLEGTPLRIIKDMQVTDEWVLEPGDALYLPPAVAHYGVALEHCITLSVGFRSPTQAELISSFTDYCCEQASVNRHLTDATIRPLPNPGLIQEDVINDFKGFLRELIDNEPMMKTWFGEYVTSPKHEGIVEAVDDEERISEDELQELFLVPEVQFRWNEGSRFSFIPQDHQIILAVDGHSYCLHSDARTWVELLCSSNQIDKSRLGELTSNDELIRLLARLFNQGSLRISTDDELDDWGDDA
ncbi:transcription factor [Hahella sp. CCB-MM4]|uniref:cupin domain-containing protein n=1 Tax=Hahella sp. (strain CCB-MM4) TaxID=1926491 RepID=UPI000B9C2794|nr:cupin domain-containing protein [Hahella sp. CCB-MM4]OZG73705.1 transcription factor [Hahella sp. CCB-MM4]